MAKMIEFKNDHPTAKVTLLASEIISICETGGGCRVYTRSEPDNPYLSTDPYEELVAKWKEVLVDRWEYEPVAEVRE